MDVFSTVQRLREIPALKNNVAGAASYGAAIATSFRVVPAAFVLPLAESPQPSPFMDQLVQQVVAQRVGVILAVQNKRDGTGGAANQDLAAVRKAVRDQLLGWAPSDESAGYEFAGGAMLDLDDQVLFWQDDFATQTTIRSQ